jgi:cyclohexyl-isocyanide hydratase
MIPNDTQLEIGSPVFDGMDQIDLTGPFEVLSRIPNSSYRLYGKTANAVRDIKGLRLTPDTNLAEAPVLDVLHVPATPRRIGCTGAAARIGGSCGSPGGF